MSDSAAAPWMLAQCQSLLAQRGHAWLLAGPSGLGQYDLALALVRAWLCEQPSPLGACGHCGSCHAVDVHTHADLCLLMPETVMIDLGWPLSEAAQSDIDDKKRKASREIRVEAMRDAVEFSQRTSARGRGKAVLVFPAERMNVVAANALLKTLEEPAGDVRFVLASDAAYQLLPTIRSRCLAHTMVWPSLDVSLAWLLEQGLNAQQAKVMLQASGGRPQDALQLFLAKADAQAWSLLPKAIASGDLGVFKDWTAPQVVNALQKLCHDLLARKVGASTRFFDATSLPAGGSIHSLTDWAKALAVSKRTAEHPFNVGLMMEALVSQAQNALNSGH